MKFKLFSVPPQEQRQVEREREEKEECVVVKRSCSVLSTSSLIKRLSDRERGKAHKKKEGKADRLTDKQTGRQTGRQTGVM